MATRVVGTNIARGGTAGRARTEELCHVDRLQAYLAVGKRLLRCLHFIRFHVTRSSGKIYLRNSDIGIQLRTEWNSHLWKDLIRWSTYATTTSRDSQNTNGLTTRKSFRSVAIGTSFNIAQKLIPERAPPEQQPPLLSSIPCHHWNDAIEIME